MQGFPTHDNVNEERNHVNDINTRVTEEFNTLLEDPTFSSKVEWAIKNKGFDPEYTNILLTTLSNMRGFEAWAQKVIQATHLALQDLQNSLFVPTNQA